MMVDVPAVRPVTSQVETFTVATAGAPLVHVQPRVVSASWVVEPAHIVGVPVMAAITGKADTVITFVTKLEQPPLLVTE